MNRVIEGLLLALPLLEPASTALATQQERDAIKLQNGSGLLVEVPLHDFIRTLKPIPRFDVQRTSNYKGYEAAWEIRESRLFLTSFTAAIDREPVPVSALFPSREPPILADWYSGLLHITSGWATRAQGYLTFERVTRHHVSKGIITMTEELRNVREDKLQKQP